MPFNKGDFTQQGVAGHVNAILRLNEKRSVGIDLTSNEEAEGCTITGAVYDLLNEEVYPIGAGVSGNIEITENGENINVAPYATATVNVAGGGINLPKTTVTIHSQEALDTVLSNILSPHNYTILSDTLGESNTYIILGENYADDITIPGNDTVTFDLYYAGENPENYAVGTVLILRNAEDNYTNIIVSNMERLEQDGIVAYIVTNRNLSSSIEFTFSSIK